MPLEPNFPSVHVLFAASARLKLLFQTMKPVAYCGNTDVRGNRNLQKETKILQLLLYKLTTTPAEQ